MDWESSRVRIGGIVTAIVVVTLLHRATSPESQHLHDFYQHLYYVPVLLAAYWYGPVGGSLAATFTTALYLVHIRLDWWDHSGANFDRYVHILLFYVMAAIIGFLARQDARHREQLEQTSKGLMDANRELQETFAQLQRADRLSALGQLSAGIAHEIRNPLGSIRGAVEILEQESGADTGSEFFGILKEETMRLNSILARFLDFARPHHGEFEPAAIDELVCTTADLLRKEAENNGVELICRSSPGQPQIEVDQGQIRQVLLNIMLNGIQAMPEGGRLDVDVESRDERIVVEISDTGPGVDDKELDRIFDPFYSTKSQGTGLGLSICHQIMEYHGGSIDARNNPVRGMTFRLELPARQVRDSKRSAPTGRTSV